MQLTKVNVNRIEPHQSYSDHFPDTTNKGTHSLSVHHKMTTQVIPFPVERCQAGIDKSLTVSFWDFCGLALCQNRILFKLKIYWFKFKKTLLCCFYNQICGWGNFDLYFFFLYGTLYGPEKKLYLAGEFWGWGYLSKMTITFYELLYMWNHELVVLCKSNSYETNKNSCLHT
jgi:hypothetical protein